jgi:hypothetical protein
MQHVPQKRLLNIYQSTWLHIQNTLILLNSFLVTIQLLRNS